MNVISICIGIIGIISGIILLILAIEWILEQVGGTDSKSPKTFLYTCNNCNKTYKSRKKVTLSAQIVVN